MKSLKVVCLLLLAAGCSVALNTNASPGATEASLMQADRDFGDATHRSGIDGWMSFYARDAIRIRYRANMVKGYDAVRAFDLPNIADTTYTLNWEPTDAYVFTVGPSALRPADIGLSVEKQRARARSYHAVGMSRCGVAKEIAGS